jgi:hypothetical protein
MISGRTKTKRRSLIAVGIALIGGLTGCAGNLTTFGNGITPVGNGPGQVKPGLYTTNATGPYACGWERLRDLSGLVPGDLLGIHTGWGGARQFVQILPKDVGIESDHCAKWVVPVKTSYNPVRTRARTGAFRVPIDLAPGTYSTPGSSTSLCQWDRLRSFDGTPHSVIASGGNYGPMTVTIAATDVGFDNHGCGTWTRVGN